MSAIDFIPFPQPLERSYTLDKLFSDDFLERVPSIIMKAIEARKEFLHMSYEEQIHDSYIFDNESLFLFKLKNMSKFNPYLLEEMLTISLKNNYVYPRKLIYLNKFGVDVNKCMSILNTK